MSNNGILCFSEHSNPEIRLKKVFEMTVDSKLNIPTVRELLTSLKNIREEWKLKTPSQKWCIFYGIGRAGFGIASIPLFNDINYLHWSGLVLLGYLTVVICLSIYTLTFYGLHGHPELGLASTTFAALCIGVCE